MAADGHQGTPGRAFAQGAAQGAGWPRPGWSRWAGDPVHGPAAVHASITVAMSARVWNPMPLPLSGIPDMGSRTSRRTLSPADRRYPTLSRHSRRRAVLDRFPTAPNSAGRTTRPVRPHRRPPGPPGPPPARARNGPGTAARHGRSIVRASPRVRRAGRSIHRRGADRGGRRTEARARWRTRCAAGWRRSWRRTSRATRGWSAPTRRARWRGYARCSAGPCSRPSPRAAGACSS